MIILGTKEGSLEAKYSLKKVGGGFYTVKSFTDVWYIATDSTDDTEDDVRALFVPLGTFYKSAFLKSISPKEMNTIRHPQTGDLCFFYEVDLEYDSDYDTDQDDDNPQQMNPDDPTDMTPKRRIYCEQVERVLEEDAQTGKPIVNVNGESIILPTTLCCVVLEISRYETIAQDFGAGIQAIRSFVNHTNEGTWYGDNEDRVLMQDIQFDEEIIKNSNGQKVMWGHVTYKALFAPDIYGHTVRPLNEGYMVRKKSGISSVLGKPELNIDPKTKQPVRVNLKLSGEVLPDGEDPIHLSFNRYAKTDFTVLGLEY